MYGSVYAVLFTNGLVKVGFTSGEQHKRIRQHIASGKSFGLSLEIFFFTEMHAGADETERNLLKRFSKKFNKNTPEYFEGADRYSVRNLMLTTGQMVAWSNIMKVSDGGIVVNPSIDPKKRTNNTTQSIKIKDKLLKLVGDFHPEPVSHGILQNRMRNKYIDDDLEDLLKEKKIEKQEEIHPRSRFKITKYHLPTS